MFSFPSSNRSDRHLIPLSLRLDSVNRSNSTVAPAHASTDFIVHHDSASITALPYAKAEEIDSSTPEYPGPLQLALLIVGICLAAFIVALDRTIVATAIPQITDDFDSPEDVGWYGSAYLLTSCALQPTYGRIYVHFDVRWSFLIALGLFEIGSLVCALAPSSTTLIVGRAIAGLGCAGIFGGVIVIITLSMPLAKRPIYMGLVGSLFGVGAVLGPLIGGAFTSQVTWRWCFYINLPVGAITFVMLIFFFHPQTPNRKQESFWRRVQQLDLVGNLLLISAVVMLLLALEWGGTTYPWNDKTVIGLLVGAGVEVVVFLAWQYHKKGKALIPLEIVSQRTVAASFASSFFLSGSVLVLAYYLPYWFQTIKNESAIESGVDLVPYLGSNFVLAMITGAFVTKVGYFTPPALLGAAIATVGFGFIYTISTDTSTARWVGYQVLAGGGIGMAIQQGAVAVQAVLPPVIVPLATTLVMFAQSLAGAIFVSVGSSILRNELSSGLEQAQLPGVNVGAVLAAGATEVRLLVPTDQIAAVIAIYNQALEKVFLIAVPLAAMAFISTLPMEWRSVKGQKISGGEA